MRIKLTAAAVSFVAGMSGSSFAGAASFDLMETSIADVQTAFKAKQITCEGLVSAYLARIDAYNAKGPALRAVLTLNPNAMKEARALDAQLRKHGGPTGNLFCVPVLLKDNFDTKDMPTSSGNVAMRASQPQSDAFVVTKMRQAGAVVLAKTNLQEFARGGVSVSSLGGQVLNPYDLTRNPGGSSGGTGAALAANMGLVGTGSDTGQSIRSPASANSLVGVRPTRGLISRNGVMPNSFTQDEIGPIARTVADAARMLDVMVGFDPNDPITALGVGQAPRSYLGGLSPDALKGARIGLLENYLGSDARHADVTATMNQLAANMEKDGATVVRFSMPGLAALTKEVGTDTLEARAAFDKYFKSLPANAPVRDFRQLVDSKTASPAIQKAMEREIAIEGGMESMEYRKRFMNREALRIALAARMAELGVDAILYPMQSILVTKAGQSDQPERNGVLSNATGFPAVTFPAGFSRPDAEAPIGVPIGAELLGLDYTEPRLLSYAYAYEQRHRVRKPPVSTPALK